MVVSLLTVARQKWPPICKRSSVAVVGDDSILVHKAMNRIPMNISLNAHWEGDRRMQNRRDQIIAEYHNAVKLYSDAVKSLVGLSGVAFEKAYRASENFRELADQWRKELEKHDQGSRGSD